MVSPLLTFVPIGAIQVMESVYFESNVTSIREYEHILLAYDSLTTSASSFT